MVITLNKTYNNKIMKIGKWKRAPKKNLKPASLAN